MCVDCWKKLGSPKIDNDAVREAAKAIDEVYRYSCVGGNLHIALDDWNLDDGSVAWCRGAIKDNIHQATTEDLETERRCLDLMMALSLEERASALSYLRGYWSPEA